MRILGIDPGLSVTGYGIIDSEGRNFRLIEAGIIKNPSTKIIPTRLNKVYNGIVEIVKEYKPRIIVLEELYSHYKHPRTAILMGHVRGVVCLAASMMRVPLIGYSATQVKKSITGNGKASKEQIQRMAQHFLNIKECPQSLDLTDALALAIAHAFYNGKR